MCTRLATDLLVSGQEEALGERFAVLLPRGILALECLHLGAEGMELCVRHSQLCELFSHCVLQLGHHMRRGTCAQLGHLRAQALHLGHVSAARVLFSGAGR